MLIDGNNLAHRCLHAYRELGFRDEKGTFVFTGLMYGFVSNLLHLARALPFQHAAVVWDGGSAYRKKLFPGYKKKRHENKRNEKVEIDYKKEMVRLEELLLVMGITQFRTPKTEADDVIGRLTRLLRKRHHVTIYSSDHDFQQLLRYSGTSTFKSQKSHFEMMRGKDFLINTGLKAKYYPHVLALAGDQTDEYPGARGIGEKTALQLLKDYGPTVQDLYSNLAKVPERLRKILERDREMVELCLKLATIRTSGFRLLETTAQFDEKRTVAEFKRFRFHSLLFEDKMEDVRNFPRERFEWKARATS